MAVKVIESIYTWYPSTIQFDPWAAAAGGPSAAGGKSRFESMEKSIFLLPVLYLVLYELGACNLGQKVIHTADSHLELEKSHDAQGM